ncbi:heme-degrading monooxygenase HmoA [Conyzicola lurida]|uniref:Heme-degrading monooxygenase HmoA n=1 Tax=Conyzicola lurida TaxID=1172621 RepID=A0A841AP67_9MICO|nr:antibiotic biosynthesis monooxygenase [Conyzicola lurida]MBB5843752.1 heme-degrading monooxygenase HmoA [Conyzicola lurida]
MDGILEHVILPVRPGGEREFEAAFAIARPLVAGMPGFRGLTLSRGIEHPNQYLMLIQWDSVEAHEIGFRGSPQYQEWRALLHHFYDPFPTVTHFAPVAPQRAG